MRECVSWGRCVSWFEADQPSQHIGFFSNGAFATQHAVAVAAKPFFGFGAVGESFGVGRRGQRGDGFAGAGVRALGSGLLGVAGAATPLFAMLGVEEFLAARWFGFG